MNWPVVNRYLSTVSNQPFLLAEARTLARCYLEGMRKEEIRNAVVEDNLLQIKARTTRNNVFQALVTRLDQAPEEIWELLADHNLEVARLSNFYLCLRQFRLLRELMAERVCDNASRYIWQLTVFEAEQFFMQKREQEPILATWSEQTFSRVVTNTLRLAHDAGLLQGRGPWTIHRPLVPPALRHFLIDRGDGPYLRYFMEVFHEH